MIKKIIIFGIIAIIGIGGFLLGVHVDNRDQAALIFNASKNNQNGLIVYGANANGGCTFWEFASLDGYAGPEANQYTLIRSWSTSGPCPGPIAANNKDTLLHPLFKNFRDIKTVTPITGYFVQ